MNRKPQAVIWALPAILFAITGFQSLSAQLRSLNNYPWAGYFAGHSDKSYRFGLLASGEIRLTVIDAKKEPLNAKLIIPIVVTIEETLPDGKTLVKKIQPDSMQSAQAASDRFDKVVVSGKVTGDTAFELMLEQNRGMILIGGRVLDPGSSKNPLRLVVRAAFSSPYPFSKEIPNEKAAEIFKKKIKGDGIALKLTDKQARTFAISQDIDAASAEVNGPGIAEAKIKICSYDGKKFVFLASPNSAMTLEHKPSQPLSKGFSLVWHTDPAKDPEGKARLAIDVR
jgi:hypothetical protein